MIKELCAMLGGGGGGENIQTRMEGSLLVNAVFMYILSRGGAGLMPQRAT
jgi:hypothetical protein